MGDGEIVPSRSVFVNWSQISWPVGTVKSCELCRQSEQQFKVPEYTSPVAMRKLYRLAFNCN